MAQRGEPNTPHHTHEINNKGKRKIHQEDVFPFKTGTSIYKKEDEIKEMKTIHFSTNKAYRKWNAYGHIHHVFKGKGPYPGIYIRGRKHRVKHTRR